MARVRFEVETTLSPAAVMSALTDFSDTRSRVWRNIDAANFRLHGQGPGWAEVTEGSRVAGGVWERNRYEWEGDHVTVTTVDSNTWAPGSGWDYRLSQRSGGGTRLEVEVRRFPRGFKGRLLGAFIALFGARRLRGDMQMVLARAGDTGLG